MPPPFVSVIIPCFNGAGFIHEAIQSTLSQTYREKEVIVIDDGSTDGSMDVLRSFGTAIRYETGPNRGGCAARNRGLELAKGDLIQFLDADDLLAPDKLERQVPLAVETAGTLVYCDFRTVIMDAKSEPLYCYRPPCQDPVILALETVIGTPAPLYGRETLANIGGWREGQSCAQDYDLHLRLACAGVGFRRLPEVLVTVRRHPGSVSNHHEKMLFELGRVSMRAYRDLEERGLLTDARCEAFAAGFVRHGREYIRCGLYERAYEQFRTATAMHPSGGLRSYGTWTRALRALVGPVVVERLVQAKRRVAASRLP